jgi:hypothetical protein
MVHPDRLHMLLHVPYYKVYKHTLKECNIYCFSAAPVIRQTGHSVTFIPTLSVTLKRMNCSLVEERTLVALIGHL